MFFFAFSCVAAQVVLIPSPRSSEVPYEQFSSNKAFCEWCFSGDDAAAVLCETQCGRGPTHRRLVCLSKTCGGNRLIDSRGNCAGQSDVDLLNSPCGGAAGLTTTQSASAPLPDVTSAAVVSTATMVVSGAAATAPTTAIVMDSAAGAIAGGVVGGVVAALLVMAIVFFACRARGSTRLPSSARPPRPYSVAAPATSEIAPRSTSGYIDPLKGYDVGQVGPAAEYGELELKPRF